MNAGAAPCAPALVEVPRAKRLPLLPLTTPQRFVFRELVAQGVDPMAARALVLDGDLEQGRCAS